MLESSFDWKPRLTRAARRVADWELALLAGLAPFLLLPTLNRYLTAFAAAGVVFAWLARWLGRGRLTRRTPLDGLILLLLLMIPVSLWVSPLPAQSVDALGRVLLGIALYYALVNTVDDTPGWRLTLVIAMLGGLAIALIGLLATDWGKIKMPFLEPIYRHLPSVIGQLGALASENDSTPGGFHPNFIGASLAILLPIAGALLATARRWPARTAILAAAATLAGVLLMTQSRLSIASLLIATGVAGLRLFPRLRAPALGLGAIAMLAVLLAGPAQVWNALTGTFAAAGFESWQRRTTLWQAALWALADYPLTGMGLATFYPMASTRYALDFPAGIAYGHAHEMYLQMGLDFGWLGMLSFIGIVGLGLKLGWPERGEGDGARPALRVGVWISLLTYALFGVFDGLPLWTKPGFLIWVLLAWTMIGRGAHGRIVHAK